MAAPPASAGREPAPASPAAETKPSQPLSDDPPPPPPVDAPPPPPPPDEAPATPAKPKTISIGDTTDQVVAAYGQPESIAKLAGKEIYVYTKMKVIFVNGKVSDVQ